MSLKVGELARHTGLTVRTLHHYDAIGLLCPSARSPAGYRLYSHADVARLHGIQALRHLGLPLAEIGRMLAGNGASLPAIVARQLRALDHEIAQASELRERLALLQEKFAEGSEPDMDDWLATLGLMATYSKYFSAAELKIIFGSWKEIQAEWPPLFKAVREFMDRGVPPDAPEIQPVIQRWMNLMARWMDDNFDLMTRWGQMYERDPAARDKDGPDPDMARYVSKAIDVRLAVLNKYFDLEQLMRMKQVSEQDWRDLARAVEALIRKGSPVGGKAAQALVRRRMQLLDQVTGGDRQLQQKLLAAYRDEPLLHATSPLPPPVREFLQRAEEAGRRQLIA